MQDVKISVIVPIYCTEAYLLYCIESIRQQSHSNLEIILVDDGSTDRCGLICDESASNDGRIRVIHQENKGVAAARNAGLEIATGEWVSFVDSDDYIEPDLYSYLLEIALRRNADIVQGGTIWEENGQIQKLYTIPEEICIDGLPAFEEKDWKRFSNWNHGKLYRRAAIGDVRYDSKISMGEDVDFNLHVLRSVKRVVLGPEAKYHYVQRADGLCHAVPTRERLLDFWKVLEHSQDEFSAFPAAHGYLKAEQFVNYMDICSKIITFRLEDEADIADIIRQDIRRQTGYILREWHFSLRQKAKLLLAGWLWPAYRILLLISKKISLASKHKNIEKTS